MIFFRPTIEPVSRAHRVQVCSPGSREACAHCLLQLQNIHVPTGGGCEVLAGPPTHRRLML